MRIITLSTFLQFLLWCLSIQNSRQAAMPLSNLESFLDLTTDLPHQTHGTTKTCHIYHKSSQGHIRIDGRNVDATGTREDPYSLLIIETKGRDKMVIKGNYSGHYLCINVKTDADGNQFGEIVARKRLKHSCVFTHRLSSKNHDLFQPVQHQHWHLAFRPNGKPKKLRNSLNEHRSEMFLIRETDEAIEKNREKYNEMTEIVNRETNVLKAIEREMAMERFLRNGRR